MFECINERLKHSDTDIGTTSWSEAPDESIFSVFKMVIHGRESLTVCHTVATCRILTNGPKAGTVEAEKLMEDAAKMWPAQAGQNSELAGYLFKTLSPI